MALKTPRAAKTRKTAEKKLSRLRKPDDMSLDEWQVALRRQFGRQQKFRAEERGRRADLLRVRGHQSRDEADLSRGHPRRRRWAKTSAPAPISPSTRWAPASTSSSRWPSWADEPGGKRALAVGYQPAYSEVYLRYGAKREVVFRPGTGLSRGRSRRCARRFFDDARPAAARGLRPLPRVPAEGGDRTGTSSAATTTPWAMIAQVRDQAQLAERIDGGLSAGHPQPGLRQAAEDARSIPISAKGRLFAAKAGRCLIADDMGLGKTIQAIAAAEILARTAGVERVLVVSPTSLKHQWQQEIEKFTGRPALVVEGLLGPPRRSSTPPSRSTRSPTTTSIHRDLDAIRRWQPDLIILDEAQRIKNWKTRTAQSVKQLDSHYAIVLTGTPLENRLEELHSIVEFVDRFRLGPMFRFLGRAPARRRGRPGGRLPQPVGDLRDARRRSCIRRTKDKVLKELPERLEKRFFVPMTEQQMEHHEENRETRGPAGAEVAAVPLPHRGRPAAAADRPAEHADVVQQHVPAGPGDRPRREGRRDWPTCWTKSSRTGRRRWWSSASGCGCTSWWSGGWSGASGGTCSSTAACRARSARTSIRRFKEDPDCRLFLATDAGGVGLNLQHASVVVNLDQPWNPAVLEQRIGRVHRLGQQRPVRVVHFIAQGTIEEGMLGAAGVQEVAVRRRAGRRRGRGLPGRHAAEAVHGIGREGHRRRFRRRCPPRRGRPPTTRPPKR